MSAFLDSNILLDVFTADPVWGRWSERRIAEIVDRRVINSVVYAEASVRFASREMLDRELSDLEVELIEPGREALFAAGKAFAEFRRRSPDRATILPDFIIGAHAAHLKVPLVTRDPRRFRTYFPDLELVAP